MSMTPKTDAAAAAFDYFRIVEVAGGEAVDAAIARELERDLALAMEELRSVAADRDAAKLAHSQLLREYDDDRQETDQEIRELKAANLRLVSDLAAVMERMNHLEALR